MVTYTALIALAENGYTTTDITAANCEYIIDRAIDYVNLLAGTSIADMAGGAGVKTVTLTDNQNAVVGVLVTCMLRAMKQTSLSNSSSTSNSSGTSSSVNVGGMGASDSSTVSTAINAASALGRSDDFTRKLFDDALRRLVGSSFRRA